MLDVDGNEIQLGAQARILPRAIAGYEDRPDVPKRAAITGTVHRIWTDGKGHEVITIAATPLNPHTHNHGFHDSPPGGVRVMRRLTAAQERLAHAEAAAAAKRAPAKARRAGSL